MKKLPSLSVFFPAFNEERNIAKVIRNAAKILPQVASRYEIIVVNDGSQDKTASVVMGLIKENPCVRLENHSSNRGYGEALKTGFYSSKYDYIVFNDGDGQFDFRQVKDFIPLIEKADLVIGFREERSDPFFRLINAKLYAMFLFILFGLKVKDVDCAFKLLKKNVIETITPLQSSGALISAELLIKAKKAGLTIKEIPVAHYPRIAGRPTGGNIGVIFNAFKEVFKLYKTLK